MCENVCHAWKFQSFPPLPPPFPASKIIAGGAYSDSINPFNTVYLFTLSLVFGTAVFLKGTQSRAGNCMPVRYHVCVNSASSGLVKGKREINV